MKHIISTLELDYVSRIEAPFVVGSLMAVPPENPLTGGFEIMEIFRSETGTLLAELYDVNGEITCTVELDHLVHFLTKARDRLGDY